VHLAYDSTPLVNQARGFLLICAPARGVFCLSSLGFCVMTAQSIARVFIVPIILMSGLLLPPAAGGQVSSASLVSSAAVSSRPSRTSDTTAIVKEAITKAVAWLHTQQLPDGGFGDKPGKADAQSNPAATSDAVYVLARLGENPGGPAWTVNGHSALDALAASASAYAKADSGQAGKVARAAAAAGANPHSFGGADIVALIDAAYDPTTGRYNPDLLFRHTLALEGVVRAGEKATPQAIDALLAARLSDGGWFWAFDGKISDIDTTGRVVETLVEAGGLRCAPVLAPTLAFLSAKQTLQGWSVGNVPGAANANSTALAVGALRAAGYDVAAWRPSAGEPSALESLLAFQEASGAFLYTHETGREESRLVATLDALEALAEPDNQDVCGTVYLPVGLGD
jgi:hypothetical protein